MRPTVTDVVRSVMDLLVCVFLCLYVCVLGTPMNPATTDKPTCRSGGRLKRNHKEGGGHWRYLANTIERSMHDASRPRTDRSVVFARWRQCASSSGDATLCQITLSKCFNSTQVKGFPNTPRSVLEREINCSDVGLSNGR